MALTLIKHRRNSHLGDCVQPGGRREGGGREEGKEEEGRDERELWYNKMQEHNKALTSTKFAYSMVELVLKYPTTALLAP